MKSKKFECEICGDRNVDILERHHIVPRTDKTMNHDDYNLAIICPSCHAKTHSGQIKIIGIYPSTKPPNGRTLIYEECGKSNCEGISEPYYVPKPKSMKWGDDG